MIYCNCKWEIPYQIPSYEFQCKWNQTLYKHNHLGDAES